MLSRQSNVYLHSISIITSLFLEHNLVFKFLSCQPLAGYLRSSTSSDLRHGKNGSLLVPPMMWKCIPRSTIKRKHIFPWSFNDSEYPSTKQNAKTGCVIVSLCHCAIVSMVVIIVIIAAETKSH